MAVPNLEWAWSIVQKLSLLDIRAVIGIIAYTKYELTEQRFDEIIEELAKRRLE